MSFRTPLSRVTGLGSAKSGTEHFWNQRLTALANVPLMLFSIWLVITLVGADRAEMVSTFANPFITGFAILTIISACIHMRLGLQVVIEDYVHTESTKWLLLMLNSFFAFGVAIVAIVSLLKLSFGG
ncbi:succinate dehydrogenase, hydrophobic membrane anchor protein [Maritalea mediterranea]|uniref:Succinate dehydrogenase hydrophobic membrane anchor subunit n=1 Tax=Maritalea mediterranea TaxID=2909667 RepID=A0ABS9EB64_9HYPH|nr:succinate dehydrogenase, hydrophobic membrane anchor protein [Maritalea mediterranea]MCF4100003.1 succinate dehydrogenase, hydrophobic membrane anchor protein [Maritalea mediterranea]